MTPLQELVTIALPLIKTRTNIERAILLEEAHKVLEGDLAVTCLAEATCLRHAEAHQMKLVQLLKEVK